MIALFYGRRRRGINIAPAATRIMFANQLRGLAALSVAVSHLVGVFWLMRDFVGLATFSPAQPGPPPALVGAISFAWFQFGPFGVGVFFLISGLVVPISLARHTRLSFLAARLLRVYPTYVAALLIEMGVLAAAAAHWHRPFTHGARALLANALLIFDLVGEPSVDLVNWTLGVEVKFYLLLALIAPWARAGKLRAPFAAAALLAGGAALLGHSRHAAAPLAQALCADAVFLVFMLIGVLFNFRLRGLLSRARFIASVAAMAALFVAAWRSGPLAAQYPVVTANYGFALALFSTLYLARRWMRPLAILDAAAAISFPFYLVHSMIGYSVMKVALLDFALGYPAALALALAAAVAVATALHLTIERLTIRLGRGLAPARTGARAIMSSPGPSPGGPAPGQARARLAADH
jgi:peptidoglycan/LPS O-acetylase OafA/YrhL